MAETPLVAIRSHEFKAFQDQLNQDFDEADIPECFGTIEDTAVFRDRVAQALMHQYIGPEAHESFRDYSKHMNIETFSRNFVSPTTSKCHLTKAILYTYTIVRNEKAGF